MQVYDIFGNTSNIKIEEMGQFPNSETIEICGLLNPAIMSMDYFWSGSRNIRNCEVSGSINHKN